MVNIGVEINGKKVDANNLENEIEGAILKEITESIGRKVGTMRCGVHGKSPIVTIKGSDLDQLTCSVDSCCDEFTQQVARELDSL
jgi:hypothetical protein